MKEYQSLALALDNMNDSLPLYVKSPHWPKHSGRGSSRS